MSTPTTRRERARLRRRPLDLAVDAAGATVLLGAALSVLVGTFDGPAWVVTTAVGLGVGVVSGAAVDRLRLPWFLLPPVLAAVVLVAAPPLTLRGTAAGALPTPSAWAALGETLTEGWQRLLTTLPPLDGAGPLSLLPFVLALVGGAATTLLALRSTAAYRPMAVPAAVFVVAAALGVLTPSGVAVRGVAVLVAGVVWGSVRARRSVTTHSGAHLERFATAGLLLTVASVVVLAATPALGTERRTVLREHVVPPLATTDRPSPLAAFRSFRPVADDLANLELVRVTGLPPGTLLRLATVDTYSGTVWAAGDAAPGSPGSSGGFLRVGARIPRPDGGEAASARVTVGPGWAGRRDLRVWLPTLGGETRIAFRGPEAQDREEELRYNLDTGSAVMPGGLETGETYVLDEQLGAPAAVPPATPPVDPVLAQTAARLVAASGPAGTDPLAQLRAVATRLRTTGAYSDGGPGEETILPGHSLGRLATFVAEREPAGNDEQFAATLALTAAYLGMPARVVLGAVPGSDGVVRGQDVRAWVEVHEGGTWTLLAPDEFVPPRDRKPSPRAVREQDRSRAAAVPPPLAQRPPSSEDGFSLDESTNGRSRTTAPEVGPELPVWAQVALGAVGGPALAAALWTALLVLGKAGRRAVRSRRGPPAVRAAAAWRDVVGTLRDAGYEVSLRDTRREVARAVGGEAVADAARAVDVATYGPADADDTVARRAWTHAARVRSDLAERVGWRTRWRRHVSLASLLPERAGVRLRVPSGIHAGRLVAVRSAR
ncbi:transglutaminase domain-containing protein [Phycicoccus sp. CSK15P-2]|uniref:transglutaminase domain-containing protein n=1 Tax=Phycicoccus sp. CSK15P-2 TaxID=2807627 RepID=UPI0019513B98|nr:transglutaminase domain-containing protein [Phycicoccus sp. CSK15P-2]MBM6404906.1 transglutaminase domain-containing protein [Phycicoccus sp. CSK15P-2]